jgi:hypothetical protein
MLERIHEIDTGAIEELTRIKRDQQVLEDRLRMMQERREGVSEAVFERVRMDYRGRLDTLEQEARPLKERAGREYRKLRSLHEELQRARDEARLAKEETEFRNGLGEFAAGEYERRAAQCAERLAARESELAEVESLRGRFLGAYRSPEELEGDAPSAGADDRGDATEPATPQQGDDDERQPALEEPVAAAAAADPSVNGRAAAAPLVADQQAADAPVSYGPFDAGATSRLEPDTDMFDKDSTALEPPAGSAGTAPVEAAGVDQAEIWHEAPTGSFDLPLSQRSSRPPAPTVADEVEDDDLSGATRILARPRLVEMDNGSAGREHPLALGRTSIGRASDNLVHLLDEAVSRHHAEVVPSPAGYVLRDLGSENGIFVNGERTPEHILSEGDIIQIGARTLVFYGA